MSWFDLTAKILLSVVITLIALGVGFYLRRRLVRSFKKSVLDSWITETLGILAVLITMVIAGFIILPAWTDLGSFLNELRTMHGIDVYQIGGQLLETILLIIFGIGIARTIRSLTLRGLGERRIDINLRTLISRICYFTALVIIGFWTLSIWQVPLGIPAAAVGIITVLITIAVQDILKDLVAGFIILVERPFFIGDEITVNIPPALYIGKVENVQLRATKLRLVSGEEIIIPNAILFGGAVMNNSSYTERRVAITVTLPDTDFLPDETAEHIQKALTEIPTIMPKPEPVVIFSKYGEEKVTLLARFWITSEQTMDISAVMQMLHRLLPSAELAIIEPSSGTM